MRNNNIRGTDHNSSNGGETDFNSTGEMAADTYASCYSRQRSRSSNIYLGSSNIGGSKRDYRGALCGAETIAPADNPLHHDAPRGEYIRPMVGIDEEDSCSNSIDSDTRILYTTSQALDDTVNSNDRRITLTRKQRQRMASKRRRENARSRANTTCRDTASNDSQTLL